MLIQTMNEGIHLNHCASDIGIKIKGTTGLGGVPSNSTEPIEGDRFAKCFGTIG